MSNLDVRKPCVSVVMAAYNHERYVGEAIDSILSQDYDNWELLIVDDKSTDGTASIIESYDDDRIIFERASQNQGTVRSFNKLLEAAQGEYVAFIGSDDVWESNKLSHQIDYMENHADVAACFSSVSMINEHGDFIDSGTDIDGIFDVETDSREYCIRRFFNQGNFLCHPSALVRKQVIDEVGFFDVRLRQLHDFDYWTRILVTYSIHITKEKLCRYRRAETANNSVSASTIKNYVRTINEQRFVIVKMIENMDADLFNQAFNPESKEDLSVDEFLICEKFFLLKKWTVDGFEDKLAALSFIARHIVNKNVQEALASHYDYSLNDFYADVAVPPQGCRLDLFDDYQKLQLERDALLEEAAKLDLAIDEIKQSTSWKISKPVRVLGKLKNKQSG